MDQEYDLCCFGEYFGMDEAIIWNIGAFGVWFRYNNKILKLLRIILDLFITIDFLKQNSFIFSISLYTNP
jgi:hypothetical protein